MSSPRETRKAFWLGLVAFFAVLILGFADFQDNGKLDNDKFIFVSLFFFSGLATGAVTDALIQKYLGSNKRDEE